jgi:hypothetical protein
MTDRRDTIDAWLGEQDWRRHEETDWALGEIRAGRPALYCAGAGYPVTECRTEAEWRAAHK